MGESTAFPPYTIAEKQCKFGVTRDELMDKFGQDGIGDFDHWMRGQTQSICDGRSYNHAKREYELTGCGPHGVVAYVWDVDRYIKGLPVVD